MTDPDTLAELRAIRALLERLVDRDAKPPPAPRPLRRAVPSVDPERAREIALAKLRRAGLLDS